MRPTANHAVVVALYMTLRASPIVAGTAVWVWSNSASPLNSALATTEFFEFLGKQSTQGAGGAMTTALLEADVENETVAATMSSRVLPAAGLAGVRIAVLKGWSGHDGPFPDTTRVLQWVNTSIKLSQASPQLTGISFDIEPSATVAGSYQQYADLLWQVRQRLDAEPSAHRLQLSIAASWGYENANVTCHDKGITTMLECAVSLVDVYTLMNYRNNAYGCFCRPPPQHNNPYLRCPADGGPIPGNCSSASTQTDGMIGKAMGAAAAVKAHGGTCRLSLGVETSCFPPSDSADRKYQYKLSFCNTSVAYLAKQMELTRQGLQAAGMWEGVASPDTPWTVEAYSALRVLEHDPQ